MASYPEAFDHMLAAWNETDPALVANHLEKALAREVRFVDPTIDLTGRDEFAANVHDVQTRNPGYVYSRTSEVDSQHEFHRYHWAIHDQEGSLVLTGFDVVATNDQGRVTSVIGFFGELPAGSANVVASI